MRGAFPEAERTLRRAKLLVKSDQPKYLSVCLENLAYVYGATNRTAEAVRALREAAKVSRGTRDIATRARIESALAEPAYLAGEPEDAAARAEAANGAAAATATRRTGQSRAARRPRKTG